RARSSSSGASGTSRACSSSSVPALGASGTAAPSSPDIPITLPSFPRSRAPATRPDDAGQEGLITWRRLYVPQVGHAVCGSLGSRHCGQVMSCGAVVFHWARRDLVLLRDILRLGTATSALLPSIRHGRPARR